jgi:outer membrane receptor for ferrienterochelin and colicins
LHTNSWGLFGLVLFLCAASTPARAQSLADEADAHFRKATAAYDRFEYEDALLHFMQSNRLSPNATTAGNVGHTFVAMKKYPEAYRWYALAQSLTTERLPELDEAMAAIADKVVLVQLDSDPPGARVYVDRKDLGSVGVTPTTIALSQGNYAFIFEADSHEDFLTQSFALNKLGSTTPVSAELTVITGHVRIEGAEGATVHLGNDTAPALCTTPCELDLPVGQQLLYYKKEGYRSQPSLVQVEKGMVAKATADLLQVTGSIRVEADQRGALVRVDGVDLGYTPAIINSVPAGRRVVEVIKPGFEVHRLEVDVPKDGQLDLGRVRLRLESLTVVSASKTVEVIEETPVPVTVITSDMLAHSGVRNLKEALTRFVPGMTAVEDHNELNVAMRGIYASSQQKILVLKDGHRLNSRAYNMANPDYSISIDPDHVQQIEVLRGPGSSIYGNVALTAVVNIVTRSGEDLDRLKTRVSIGNFGQRNVAMVGGWGLGDAGDLRLWADATHARGEEVEILMVDDYAEDPHAGVAVVGGVRDPASYDMGFRWQRDDLHVSAERRYGKHTEPFTSAGVTGLVYDADQMPTLRNTGPGLGSLSHHFEAGLSTDLGDRIQGEVTGYFDTNEIFGPLGTGHATSLLLNWLDQDVGGLAQLTAGWGSPIGDGSLLMGLQAELMELKDSSSMRSENGLWTTYAYFGENELLLRTGAEQTYAGFFQVKQELGKMLVLNAGGRLDYKVRREGEPVPEQPTVLNLSPRVALVFQPVQAFDLKLSYASSFVDAPYWYRYNTLPDYAGAVDLLPERLTAIQVTPTVRLFDSRLRSSTNVAYNQLTDFVFRDNEALAAGQPAYRNAGDLTSIVVEEEISFLETWLRAHTNLTYQQVLDVQDYGADPESGRIHNVPSLVANANLAVNPLYTGEEHLWLNLGVRYLGPQLAPIQGTSLARPDAEANLAHELDGVVLLDASVRLEDLLLNQFTVQVTASNLLDTYWVQGGATRFPYPQPGRWFNVAVEYAF